METLRILCNESHRPDCPGLELVSFGPGRGYQLHYDYLTPFPDFVRSLLATGERLDGVLLWLPEVYQLPPGIEACPLRTCALLSDWNLTHFQTMVALDDFDLVLMDRRGTELMQKLQRYNVSKFNAYGLHVAPFADEAPQPKQWDVVFAGNLVPSVQKARGRWLRRVLRLRDRLKIRIETGVHGAEFRRLLMSGKVVFNNSIRGEANMRVFETLAAGGAVFLEEGNQELTDFLPAGQGSVSYGESDMEERLLRLVHDDALREELVAAAQRDRAKWSVQARWGALLDILRENCGKPVAPVRGGAVLDPAVRTLQRLAMDLLASKRFSPLAATHAQVDRLLAAPLNPVSLNILLGTVSLQKSVSDALLGKVRGLVAASTEAMPGCVWNLLHGARILRTAAGARPDMQAQLAAEEMELWKAVLDRMAAPMPHYFHGSFMFSLPFSRHHDFQAALWNAKCPGTFPAEPDLPTYLQHWALHSLGELMCLLGLGEDARALLQQAARLYPRHAETWWRLAQCDPVDSPRRMVSMETAFDLDPLNPQFGLGLLEAKVACNELDGARTLAWELEALQPLQLRAYSMSPQGEQRLREDSRRLLDYLIGHGK